MVEIARTHDLIRLSWLKAVLEEAGVAFVVFDAAAATTWPGAFPARLMVDPKDAWMARSALSDAETGDPADA